MSLVYLVVLGWTGRVMYLSYLLVKLQKKPHYTNSDQTPTTTTKVSKDINKSNLKVPKTQPQTSKGQEQFTNIFVNSSRNITSPQQSSVTKPTLQHSSVGDPINSNKNTNTNKVDASTNKSQSTNDTIQVNKQETQEWDVAVKNLKFSSGVLIGMICLCLLMMSYQFLPGIKIAIDEHNGHVVFSRFNRTFKVFQETIICAWISILLAISSLPLLYDILRANLLLQPYFIMYRTKKGHLHKKRIGGKPIWYVLNLVFTILGLCAALYHLLFLPELNVVRERIIYAGKQYYPDNFAGLRRDSPQINPEGEGIHDIRSYSPPSRSDSPTGDQEGKWTH